MLLQTGTCALFFAAQGGFLEIVKELLEKEATVDLPSQVPDLFFFLCCYAANYSNPSTNGTNFFQTTLFVFHIVIGKFIQGKVCI